jgi:hypothetical protein
MNSVAELRTTGLPDLISFIWSRRNYFFFFCIDNGLDESRFGSLQVLEYLHRFGQSHNRRTGCSFCESKVTGV